MTILTLLDDNPPLVCDIVKNSSNGSKYVNFFADTALPHIHKNDIVPYLVTHHNDVEYYHFNSEIWYSPNNITIICDDDAFQDPNCSNGKGFRPMDHLFVYDYPLNLHPK